MYFDSVKVAYILYHTPYIVALYKYLRKTEIYKDGGYTKEDLQYNQYNHDPFKSFSVGRVDTFLEELEHILKDLPGQSRPVSSRIRRKKRSLTSTRALSRSTRCEISRYDLAALYSGSKSGNDQKNSCKSASIFGHLQ